VGFNRKALTGSLRERKYDSWQAFNAQGELPCKRLTSIVTTILQEDKKGGQDGLKSKADP